MSTVPFMPEAVRAYLDDAILQWRRVRSMDDEQLLPGQRQTKSMADIYIDAYQSVRMSLFGECLL